MPSMIRVLDEETIRELLPPEDCIEIMADAMRAVSEHSVISPPRTFSPLFDNSGAFACMTASASSLTTYGAKLLTLHRDNPSAGRPLIHGVIVLFEHSTGTPVAMANGATITALRTAAVSGLATKLLAREDASTHGVFGTGVQAATHIDAIAAARPSVRRVLVWGRSEEKTEAFAREQSHRTGFTIVSCRDAQRVAACDIVSTVTAAPTPIVHGDWLAPGAHVNVVGSHRPHEREVDTRTVVRSAVYVDVLENALQEAGDVLIPISEGAVNAEDIVGEIGQIVSGAIHGRESESQITLFKSLGHAAQDLFATHAVYIRATANERGTSIVI